jgi:hypothetical protein
MVDAHAVPRSAHAVHEVVPEEEVRDEVFRERKEAVHLAHQSASRTRVGDVAAS